VLGPLTIGDPDDPVSVPAAKERALLADLLCRANRHAAAASLIDDLWGENPPRTAAKTLQTYVLHLRRFLGSDLRTEPGGYRLCVQENELDAAVFEAAVGEARLTLLRGDPARAAERLAEVLALWRGRAYEDVDCPVVAAEAVRLEELRAAAEEDWIEARLGAGLDNSLVGDLEALVARYPLRERMWAHLMTALYRAGRQSDALEAYQRARRHLVAEIGVEPGPQLRRMEQAVLEHSSWLDTVQPIVAPATSYASGDGEVQVAYWVLGQGHETVVFVSDTTLSIELILDMEVRALFDRLSASFQVVGFQRRGTGCSDRDPAGHFAPPEDCVDDLDAVLDQVGVKQAALIGWGHGGQLSVAYAAAHPERVSALVLVNSYARLSRAPDYPAGFPNEELEQFLRMVEQRWGRLEPKDAIFGPEGGGGPEIVAAIARFERLTFSPREVVEVLRTVNEFDVRRALPFVRCPSLVVFLRGSVTGEGLARYLAEHIEGARFLELPGYFQPTGEAARSLADAIAGFLEHPRP
jgi:DNA-binding SARP family transcriptional activator/pimeloyl-ACP methyl ester carboxylesterase